MKIRTKIFIELCLGITLFISAVYFQGQLERKQLLLFIEEKKQEKQLLFNKILKLKGEALATLAIDYTYWDEMVSFTKSRDPRWAKENLDAALATYKTDAIFIYDKKGVLFYKITDPDKKVLAPPPLPPLEIKNIFLDSPLRHFFTSTPLGIAEVRGAIIVPTSDEARKTPAQGYLFAVRLWDKNYLQQLEDLTQSRITLENREFQEPSSLSLKQETLAFSRPLKDFDGATLAHTYVVISSEDIKAFNQQMRQRYFLLFLFAASSSLIIFILYLFWVYLPLRYISLALSTETESYLSRMKRRGDEFGEIARVILESFNRKLMLEQAYTKLQETQDQLIQAEKLNAVGQLASGVAHEVKNPLATIMQSVDYLADKVPEAEKDILRMIRENVARADNIVRTLVDFSRASKLEIKAQDINRILEKSLLLIQHEALNKEIKITRELQEDILLAMVDENKIEQVFVNIFLNAIQAMPKEGELNIRTRSAQETISVEITDTGTGIAEENIKKVFDPFFTTKGPRGGAGLGLAVTRNIIELHRGSIEMQSRVGEGTKVIITLKAKS